MNSFFLNYIMIPAVAPWAQTFFTSVWKAVSDAIAFSCSVISRKPLWEEGSHLDGHFHLNWFAKEGPLNDPFG